MAPGPSPSPAAPEYFSCHRQGDLNTELHTRVVPLLQHKQNQIFGLNALMAKNSEAGSSSLCPTPRPWLPFCRSACDQAQWG